MFALKRDGSGRRVIVMMHPQDYPVALRVAAGRRRSQVRRAAVRVRYSRVGILDLSQGGLSGPRRALVSGLRRQVLQVRTVDDLWGQLAQPNRLVVACSSSRRAEVARELLPYAAATTALRRVVFLGRPVWRGQGRFIGPVDFGSWSQRPAELSRPVGVFTHIYYTELIDAVRDDLARLHVPYTLFISTDHEVKAERIRAAFPGARVRVVTNRGRDLGAKLLAFRDEHQQHDVVLHLHAKRTPGAVGNGESRQWHRHIVECLLGSRERIDGILALLADDNGVGMVIPEPWSAVAPTSNWSANRAVADVLTARWGWPELPADKDLHFPVGSMFWARSSALRPLLQADLSVDDLGAEEGQRDGTVAHALERLLGVAPLLGGFDVAAAWSNAALSPNGSPGATP